MAVSRKDVHRVLATLFFAMLSQQALASLSCNGPTIDARVDPYNALPAVTNQNVGAYDEDVLRANVMTAAAARYRLRYGPGSLNAGRTFKMIYKGGSKECGLVASVAGTVGAIPIPDTQRPEPGGTIEVESTKIYLRQFNQTSQIHGTYQVCYDYYSNGELTETQCTVQIW